MFIHWQSKIVTANNVICGGVILSPQGKELRTWQKTFPLDFDQKSLKEQILDIRSSLAKEKGECDPNFSPIIFSAE